MSDAAMQEELEMETRGEQNASKAGEESGEASDGNKEEQAADDVPITIAEGEKKPELFPILVSTIPRFPLQFVFQMMATTRPVRQAQIKIRTTNKGRMGEKKKAMKRRKKAKMLSCKLMRERSMETKVGTRAMRMSMSKRWKKSSKRERRKR